MRFHGREDSVKSTNVARNRRMSTDSNSQLEPCRVAKWRLSFYSRPHARGLRALWPRAMSMAQVRQINDGPQPISLMVQHTNPGLACAPDKAHIEVPSSAGASTTCRVVRRVRTVRISGVSSPAFPPRSPTSASSSQFLSLSNHLFFLRVDHRFDVQVQLSLPADSPLPLLFFIRSPIRRAGFLSYVRSLRNTSTLSTACSFPNCQNEPLNLRSSFSLSTHEDASLCACRFPKLTN